MFTFAITRDWRDGNPSARVEKPGVEQKRERVLTDDELGELWALLERFPATEEKQAPRRKRAKVGANGAPFCPVSPALAAVQKMRLVTAQRGGAVIHMRWCDLDLDAGWWIIPAEYSKNGKPHREPLSADAIAIITAQQPEADKREGFVFVNRDGVIPVARVKKAGAACARALETTFRSHDLRRTAATRMAAAGIPSAHIGHVLNRTPADAAATRVYDRHTYDDEKRIALDTWARVLRAILDDARGATVVPITERRRRA
jgi:integrase